jgi:type VI secretion system secreted protein Hcp
MEHNMAIYIEYEGIKGNVTAEGFDGQIKVLSLSFGVSRGISMESGHMANREATRPSLSEVTFTKEADISTTPLFKEAVTGAAGKLVKIRFAQTGADKVVIFMDYELQDCLVSGYSISAGADGNPVESISLSYSKVLVNYHDYDKTNAGKSPQRAGYDLTTAKPL